MSRAYLSAFVLLAGLGACSDVAPTEPAATVVESPAGLMRSSGGHVDPGVASTDTTKTKKKPDQDGDISTFGYLGSGG